jgi:hypothetical protein
MPVLTEEAVERTGSIEDGQVVVAVHLTPFADPGGHTVGGQGVIIPVEDPLLGGSRQVD